MNKKAIAILGGIFILIAGTLGFLIYSKYSKKDTSSQNQITTNPENNLSTNPIPTPIPPTPIPPTPIPSTTPENLNSDRIFKLSEDKVVSPILFFDGSGVSYFDKQGQLYQTTIQNSGSGPLQLTRKRSLEISPKIGVTKILWPAMGDSFIAEFQGSGKKTWSTYDSKTGLYADLPIQISTVDWASDGQKIYYIWSENGKASLNMSDPNSKNWKKISEIWDMPDEIKVSPDGRNVLYYKTINATSTNPLYLTTPDGKVWQTLVKTGNNIGALWSPDSQKFIFAKKDPASQKVSLWYYNFFTGEIKDLKLPTLISKIIWDKDSKYIYASVPKNGIASEGISSEDDFVKFDTETLSKTEFSTGSAKIDAQDLFLNSTSDKLFFKNALDENLYYLDLNK